MEKFFTQTSHDTYDRHRYQVIMKDGTSILFEHYDEAQNYWYSRVQLGNLLAIDVIDKPKNKKKPSGF